MAYEIPQQLQYSEKIMFNMDFKQLAYAFIFGLTDFILFFKTPFNIQIRVSLIILPTLLAMGFMFFDLDKYLKNLYHWLRFRKTDNIKEWIGVKSIDKYIKTKTQIAIIQVFPINFGIKGKDEKDAITRQFLKL